MLASALKMTIIIIMISLSSFAYGEDKNIDKILYGQNAAAGNYATINGIKLYYETYGQGEPLLLIHGNGGSIANLKAQIAYFSKKYKVIVADSRGHGKSDLGTEPLSYKQIMEDLNGLLDHLGVSKTALFGWSDGGILGLLLALNHPEKVGKMAIMAANLQPGLPAFDPWLIAYMEKENQQIDDMIAEKDTTKDWPLQKQLLNLLQTQPNIKTQSLARITSPVLVMAGDRDLIRIEHTIEIFQNLKNSQLVILPHQTHFASMTDPVTFNALLDDFFGNPFTKPSSKDFIQ